MRKAVLYSATWLVAVSVATAIGIASIEAVGDAARGRGPLGPVVDPRQDVTPSELPTAGLEELPAVNDEVRGEYGVFEVTCRGPYALGERIEPANGWRAISFEPGPDDDVDALFARGNGSLEVEVFCNRGRPTLADLERNELHGGWDDR